MKKTIMPNSIESLGYIKCYSLRSPELLKALVIPTDTTVRGSAVDREDLNHIGNQNKKSHFSSWSIILLFSSFSKTLLATEKRLTGRKFLAVDLSPTFLNNQTTDESFWNNLENKSLSDICGRVQVVCIKNHAQGSLEPPLEYNQDQTPWMSRDLLWPF